jgi:iron complex outermembrane receptor protein
MSYRIRVRGSDATLVNVTISPHIMIQRVMELWVNMPDFASSVESLQLQRGVGLLQMVGGAS